MALFGRGVGLRIGSILISCSIQYVFICFIYNQNNI